LDSSETTSEAANPLTVVRWALHVARRNYLVLPESVRTIMNLKLQFAVSEHDLKAFARWWLDTLSRLLAVVIIVVMVLRKITLQSLALPGVVL
jgi:hypothetical protein